MVYSILENSYLIVTIEYTNSYIKFCNSIVYLRLLHYNFLYTDSESERKEYD